MWATGRKTIDERISQGPSSADNVPGPNYRTVLEQAQRRGMKVGDVSTAEITDATSAVLASHVSLRKCQGPADMSACPAETKAAGGLGSIAEQEVDHRVDVLLGGGRNRFEQPITGGAEAGQNVVQSAQGKGYQYVTDAAGLSGAGRNKPVLGLFTGGNMSVEWSGPGASTGKGNAPAKCTEDQRPSSEPSLAEMTGKAIGLLEGRRGFFLQVEGASIDKQDHATMPAPRSARRWPSTPTCSTRWAGSARYRIGVRARGDRMSSRAYARQRCVRSTITDVAFTIAVASDPSTRPSSSIASRVTAAVSRNEPASISISPITPSTSIERTIPGKRLRADSESPVS